MPRIPDVYLDCVLHLYRDEKEAREGADSGGTGFLLGVPMEAEAVGRSDLRYLYAVTNRHVIDKGFTCFRLNTKDGSISVRQSRESDWFPHNTADIAVAPLRPDPVETWSPIMSERFADDDVINLRDIGIGDEVFFVGRFLGHDGRQKNRPSVRFGNISMMPGEPIESKNPDIEPQVSFLVEARSLPGYSGSPAFVRIPPLDVRPGSTTLEPVQHGPFLLGIVWSYLSDHELFTEPGKEDLHFVQSSGMAGVVPAQRLKELLKYEEVKRNRMETGREWLKNRP